MAMRGKPPTWFWIVAVIALLWALAGGYASYTQMMMTPEALAALEPAQRDAYAAMTLLPRAGYIIAVTAGLLGALLLLLRSKIARPLFILSLVGIVIQFGWFFGPYDGLAKLGPASAIFPAFIALACIAQIWFVGFAAKRGWMR